MDRPGIDAVVEADAAPGPVARFAAQLRELRTRSGSPSFRHLARMTHYSSSTLADATAGKRLPTEAVVKAFVSACGEDPADWILQLRQASAEAARPAEASSADLDLDPAEQSREARRVSLLGRGRPVAAAIGLLGIGLTAGVLVDAHPAARNTQAAAPFTAVPTAVPSANSADGADPDAAGCAKDARLIDKSPVMIAGAQVGALELMYSQRCGSGWARLYLYPGQPTMMGEVTVRSSDGRASSMAEPLIKQVDVYTNVIVPGSGGCLGAQAVVLASGRPPVSAAIPCQAPAG